MKPNPNRRRGGNSRGGNFNPRANSSSRIAAEKRAAQRSVLRKDPRYTRAVQYGLLQPGQEVGVSRVQGGSRGPKVFSSKLAERQLSTFAQEASTKELQARQREEMRAQAQEQVQMQERIRKRRSSPRSLIAQLPVAGTLGQPGTLG